MTATDLALVLATVLCSLTAGLLFAFAVIVMPGLHRLRDRDFLRAFQQVDGVIQRGQPLFGMVWAGSVVALVVALVLARGGMAPTDRALLWLATATYLLGVQLPTFVVNVPLNREVQAVEVDGLDDAGARAARERFESRWNRWNRFRTILAVLAATALAVLLGRA